jgi:hypothetical protein
MFFGMEAMTKQMCDCDRERTPIMENRIIDAVHVTAESHGPPLRPMPRR